MNTDYYNLRLLSVSLATASLSLQNCSVEKYSGMQTYNFDILPHPLFLYIFMLPLRFQAHFPLQELRTFSLTPPSGSTSSPTRESCTNSMSNSAVASHVVSLRHGNNLSLVNPAVLNKAGFTGRAFVNPDSNVNTGTDLAAPRPTILTLCS